MHYCESRRPHFAPQRTSRSRQSNAALQNIVTNIGTGELLSKLQVLQNPALLAIQDVGNLNTIGFLDVETNGALTTLSLPRLVVADQIIVSAANLPQCWETQLDAQLTGMVLQQWSISSTPGTCN